MKVKIILVTLAVTGGALGWFGAFSNRNLKPVNIILSKTISKDCPKSVEYLYIDRAGFEFKFCDGFNKYELGDTIKW